MSEALLEKTVQTEPIEIEAFYDTIVDFTKVFVIAIKASNDLIKTLEDGTKQITLTLTEYLDKKEFTQTFELLSSDKDDYVIFKETNLHSLKLIANELIITQEEFKAYAMDIHEYNKLSYAKYHNPLVAESNAVH